MTTQQTLSKAFTFLACASLLISGCAAAITLPAEAQAHFQPVSALTLPTGVTLVGLGEATHGNAEFVALRVDVLEQLVHRYGFRAFAIEGDFGGAQVVNDYVLNGAGTAEAAVRAIGFGIYNTQQMVDLVEWIRQHNLKAAPEGRIHFYGFDMQRYDHNLHQLLAYFEQVDPTQVEPARAALADLNDATLSNQQPQVVEAGLQAIRQVRAALQREEERYTAASSPAAFEMADQYAATIEQNATLRSAGGNYMQMRDRYMAEKVHWIVDYEASLGRGKVLIAGHNGHIEESAATPQYRSMGSRLAEQFGDAYFTIGTEFLESTFSVKDGSTGKLKHYSVKNRHALNRAFRATELQVAYLDIHPALEDTTLQPLLVAKQPMSNIGNEFADWYRFIPMFYTIQMVPDDAYDAILFVQKATPTTMLDQ